MTIWVHTFRILYGLFGGKTMGTARHTQRSFSRRQLPMNHNPGNPYQVALRCAPKDKIIELGWQNERYHIRWYSQDSNLAKQARGKIQQKGVSKYRYKWHVKNHTNYIWTERETPFLVPYCNYDDYDERTFRYRWIVVYQGPIYIYI